MIAKKILKQGPGIPIVFFHGFLGRSEDWNAVCSFFPPSQCVGFDLPGHGDSPFMEHFKIDVPYFHLVGYSMGGRIALSYAEKYPEQIASLTLMSTHPGLKTEEEKRKRLESDYEWVRLLSELPIDEFLLRWYDQSIFKPYKPDLEMRKQQNIPNLKAAFMHYSLGKQRRYEIDRVLVGERDEKFKALFKHPVLIPHAGHMVHLENPEGVASVIQSRIHL